MRILFWNILHGGGTRRTPEIALALLDWGADVNILCEYRTTLGGQLRGVLADHGWEHQECTDPPEGRNGLCVVSRVPIERVPDAAAGVEQRVLGFRVPGADLLVLAAHVPPLEAQDGEAQAVWKALLGAARRHAGEAALVIGDLNAGRRWQDEAGVSGTARLFREDSALQRVGSEAMGRLWIMGYRDVWRERGAGLMAAMPVESAGCGEAAKRPEIAGKSRAEGARSREFSWFSHLGRGVRIDHVLASGALFPRVRGAWYEHGVRESGVSDHAAIAVDIS